MQPTIDSNTNRFNPGQGYTYDLNGNVINDPANGGRSFTFNGDNKQTEVRDANNVLIGKYFYDGEGKRVKKVTASETTIFVYSGSKLIAEYSTAAPGQNPTTNYVMTDVLQSVRAISGANGQVISRRDFMPFGEELLPDGTYRTTTLQYGSPTDKIRQKFTGYQKDEETNLDFAEARMYQNKHGRFTAVDPLLASGKSANPQTFNRYVYVLNNPLVFTDPSGLQVGDYKGTVYTNADNTAFSNGKKDGYTPYEGGRRLVNATDGWTYAIRQGGWTQIGKTDPNIVDRAAQAVSDTVLGGGGTLYNGLAGVVNATNWAVNTLPNFSGTGDRVGYLSYYEPRTSGEAGASLATTFLSFYAGGAASTGRSPFFAGFSSESLTAGSIRNVNPFGCLTNCVNAAIATDATLAGRPATALRGGVTPISKLQETFGGKFEIMTQEQITQALTNGGNGARGIVFGNRAGRPGHVFNGVNQNGNIRFLDGQTGRPANWNNGYNEFRYLPTNQP